MGGSCNTEVKGECRFESKSKVGISPLIGMTGLKDENDNLNVIDETHDCSNDTLDSSLIESNDMENEDLGLIDLRDFSKTEPELEYFSN